MCGPIHTLDPGWGKEVQGHQVPPGAGASSIAVEIPSRWVRWGASLSSGGTGLWLDKKELPNVSLGRLYRQSNWQHFFCTGECFPECGDWCWPVGFPDDGVEDGREGHGPDLEHTNWDALWSCCKILTWWQSATLLLSPGVHSTCCSASPNDCELHLNTPSWTSCLWPGRATCYQ